MTLVPVFALALAVAPVQTVGRVSATAPDVPADRTGAKPARLPICGDSPSAHIPPESSARAYWREHARELAVEAGAGSQGTGAEKVRVLEAAWEATGSACFLYFAYRANDAAGHYVRAYGQARELQALGEGRVPGDAGESARRYLEEVQQGAYTCEVGFGLPAGRPARTQDVVQATYLGVDANSGPGTVESLSLHGPLARLRIGTWALELTASSGLEFSGDVGAQGDSRRRRVLVVDDCGSEPFTVDLRNGITPPAVIAPATVRPAPKVVQRPPVVVPGGDRPRPNEMRRPSDVGIGVGAGLTVLGGVLVGVGAGRLNRTCPLPVDNYNESDRDGTLVCRERLESPLQLRSSGAGVLGAGLGLWVPALALRRSRSSSRAIWLPVVGGLSAAAGVVMVAVGASQFNRNFGVDADHSSSMDPTWGGRTSGAMALHTVGGAFTGLGAGLLAASLARLGWRLSSRGRNDGAWSVSHTRRAALRIGPARLTAGAALVLSGRF